MNNQINPFEEKRRHKRVAIDAEAECEIFATESQAVMLNRQMNKLHVKVENISMGGLQIITDMQMPVEQILRMKVDFIAPKCAIWVYSQVRWSCFDAKISKYRVGLQFFYLREKYSETCAKIIESHPN